jgi:hypothetical protein
VAGTQLTHSLDEQIGQWRSYLSRRRAINTIDVAELEDHLREQIAGLTTNGLTPDEAFLVAVKRMGDLDAVSREFAREHSDRLWKQLVLAPTESGEPRAAARKDGLIALGFAVLAGIAVKLPSFFGKPMIDANEAFYIRNAPLFVMPLLAAYFTWKRNLEARTIRLLAIPFAAATVIVNAPFFATTPPIMQLTTLHLPIALWFAVGIAYAGGRWNEVSGRMDFIRFSGELFIYYVLIALGGGLFMGFTALIFTAIGINVEMLFQTWIIPCGAAGALIVASWLVEAKQSVVENMAPVLTRIFTPLFALSLVTFLVTMLVTGRGINIEREALIAFDGVLAVVLGLLLSTCCRLCSS